MKEKHTFTLLSALAEKLKEFQNGRRILLLAHEKPDGDAIGSLLGMYCMLKENNFEAEIFLPGEIPDMYKDFLSCPYRKVLTPSDLKNFDLLLFLDCANQKRCSADFLKDKENILPVLNIDHHPDNAGYGKWNLLAHRAATAEMAFALCESFGNVLPESSVNFFLMGLLTDTGGFRFDNTDPEALRAGARLLEYGARLNTVINQIYFNKPYNQQQFEAELLAKYIYWTCNKRVAWSIVPQELLDKYEFDLRNAEGVIDQLRAIAGTEVVAIISHRGGRSYRILRAGQQ